MELQNERNKKMKKEFSGEKRPYEPPKAVLAPLKIEERLMQCNFSSFRVCGPNR